MSAWIPTLKHTQAVYHTSLLKNAEPILAILIFIAYCFPPAKDKHTKQQEGKLERKASGGRAKLREEREVRGSSSDLVAVADSSRLYVGLE